MPLSDPTVYIDIVPTWFYYCLVFLLALAVTLLLTPLAKRLALYLNIVDRPGERKIHHHIVPYLGGLAIYTGFWITIIVSTPDHIQQLGAIVLCATLVMLLGLWDDRNGMKPGIKIFGQFVCALVIVGSDIQFQIIENQGVNAAVTIVWIVGITNALNLLDNMDGLSTGATLISAGFLFLIAAHNGQFLVATTALALAGACFGFWWFNKPPASIFMGDAGSLFIGFMVAVLGVKLRPPVSGLDSTFWVVIVLLGLPILDTTLVTTQRILNGRKFYLGGRDHCSHRLVFMGMSRQDAVLWLYMVAVFYGFWALVINALGMNPLIFGVVAFFTITLYFWFSSIDPYSRHTPELGPVSQEGQG